MPKHDHVTTSSKVYQGWPISVRCIGLREKAKPLHELTENQIIFWGKEHQKCCDQLKEEGDSLKVTVKPFLVSVFNQNCSDPNNPSTVTHNPISHSFTTTHEDEDGDKLALCQLFNKEDDGSGLQITYHHYTQGVIKSEIYCNTYMESERQHQELKRG